MFIVFKYIYKLILVLFILSLSFNVSGGASVQVVKDLRLLKQQAEIAGLPILLLFTADDCEYCEVIRQNYLIPMIQSGDYASRILFRQVYVEDYSYLRDRNADLIGGDQLAMKYDVDVTPTIVFIDADGKELVERIIGLSGADYFDHQLNAQISRLNK